MIVTIAGGAELRLTSRKTCYGYTGTITLYCLHQGNMVRIWSEKAGPTRLTKPDALEDAEKMAKELGYIH